MMAEAGCEGRVGETEKRDCVGETHSGGGT